MLCCAWGWTHFVYFDTIVNYHWTGDVIEDDLSLPENNKKKGSGILTDLKQMVSAAKKEGAALRDSVLKAIDGEEPPKGWHE